MFEVIVFVLYFHKIRAVITTASTVAATWVMMDRQQFALKSGPMCFMRASVRS